MISEYRETISSILSVDPESIVEYPASYTIIEEDQVILCKIAGEKKLLTVGDGMFVSRLEGKILSDGIKICPLSHENRLVLNQFLPHTKPSAFGRKIATFGLGDRLGIATPGHIRCFEGSSAKPILAQQSKRELDLTGRTYEQVLDDVSFAVFQEGYRGGFGADGDHLKQWNDIREALDCGYTMITLDCSEKIGKGIEAMTSSQLEQAFANLPADYRRRVEETYLSRVFPIGLEEYHFTREELIRCVLVYKVAIEFVKEVFFDLIQKAGHAVDFELSIDETEAITTAQGHLFVAMELDHLNIEVTSLAPRFIGEFQKGIDYIGDITEFEHQLKQHAAIADHFGYKLSIHSGSDKFSVFPLIGLYTAGRLHLKTSGTNWLEAVGVIAEKNPKLYRSIHQKALEYFEQAKTFYHVSADPAKAAALNSTSDEMLTEYLTDTNSRQLLHITYGFILGDSRLRDELYRTLSQSEERYYGRLINHIGRHLQLVSLKD